MLRAALFITTILLALSASAQIKTSTGILTANVMDEAKKPLEGASAEIFLMSDSLQKQSVLTDKDGSFSFQNISYGYYRLRLSYVGFQTLTIDSIYFRSDRADFNLNDLTLRPKNSSNLSEVIVYSEKPLIQSKDGNITFNAAESALSAGSNASELLTSVPLVTRDPDGKISVRGKEPKILIDDKPVELNLQQLQDLLESMPGSSIEKIEVMTNPPPQYANEQGGVINIVTKKGKVGRTGRLNISGGTRGETAISGNYTYRRQGLAIAINGGIGYNRFHGNGYSHRQNIYTDSINYFNTSNTNMNRNLRPNLRFNMDYDLDNFQSINVVLQLNTSDYSSKSNT
ncbi:MAG TPA: carboxypeptidase regulatory-like domain-containing protein, partial [Chitinophagaceae bacterium]|nr:carboxypeptidase regulatory-like domain-containing protein [Chitinophagaceae bacterium]